MSHPWGAPDPSAYRHELPVGLWTRWLNGEFESRAEFWATLERLWGPDDVRRLLELDDDALRHGVLR